MKKESILWAVKTVRTLCSGEEVIADKNRCAFSQWHPRVTGGEADCLCPALGKLFDLKSGQIRNYWEQQASYAKSFMEREFMDEITCHLLYCDQQQIVTRKFTYREAISIVNGVVDAVDRGGGPRLCDYCGWCASQDTCPLRNRAAQEMLTLAEAGTLEESFAEIAENPSRLAEFVTKAAVLESYVKKGKKKILDYLNNGTEVPGFRRVSRKGADTVAPEDVAKYATWIGVPKLLKSYGPLKADVFRALFAEALPEQQFPEELVRTGAGSSYVKKNLRLQNRNHQITIMFSYISEGEPSEYGFLPAGVYEGKIVKMEEGISQGAKTRGCPQLAVHIRAFGPEGAATVRYYLTNSKDLAWKIDLFVKNVTGNVYQPGQQVIINPAEYLGKPCYVRLNVRQGDKPRADGTYPEFSNCEDVLGPDEARAIMAAQDRTAAGARRSAPASAPGGPAGQQPHERHGGTAGGRRRNPLLINSHEQADNHHAADCSPDENAPEQKKSSTSGNTPNWRTRKN